MGQGRDHLAQDAAIALDIGGADLQKVVEGRRHHVALFHLGHRQHGLVEGGQRGLARVEAGALPMKVEATDVTNVNASITLSPSSRIGTEEKTKTAEKNTARLGTPRLSVRANPPGAWPS